MTTTVKDGNVTVHCDQYIVINGGKGLRLDGVLDAERTDGGSCLQNSFKNTEYGRT